MESEVRPGVCAGQAAFLREHLELLPRGKVLDIAMGEGRNGVYLAAQGYQVLGWDTSEVGLQKAHRLARERNTTIETKVVDLENTQLVKDEFAIPFWIPGEPGTIAVLSGKTKKSHQLRIFKVDAGKTLSMDLNCRRCRRSCVLSLCVPQVDVPLVARLAHNQIAKRNGQFVRREATRRPPEGVRSTRQWL